MESMLDMNMVLNRIRELRNERGWTQQELAEAVGVSRQSINSIERQRYEPSLGLALTFARLFGLPTDDIRTETLFKLGLAAMALRGALFLVYRTNPTSSLVDFLSGLLIGIGGSLLLIVAWRKGRGLRGEPTGA